MKKTMTSERKVHVYVLPSPPLPALALAMFIQAASIGTLSFRYRHGQDEDVVLVDDNEAGKSYIVRHYWELADLGCLDGEAVRSIFMRLGKLTDAAVRGDYEEVRWQLKQALQDYYLHRKQQEEEDEV